MDVTTFEDNKADAYVVYSMNAAGTRSALPQLTVMRIPNDVNVRSAYSIGARAGSVLARVSARSLCAWGRGILHAQGFA